MCRTLHLSLKGFNYALKCEKTRNMCSPVTPSSGVIAQLSLFNRDESVVSLKYLPITFPYFLSHLSKEFYAMAGK